MLLLVSWKSSAQIITSKKEALKKGVYSYAEKENDSETAMVEVTEAPVSLPSEKITVDSKETIEDKEGRKTEKADEKERKRLRKLIESQRPDPDFIPAPDESYFAQQVVNNAMQFEGITYRTGGTTKEGMDCSGMVYTTFNIFDISLPRSSHEMAKAGRKIKLTEVRKGDLLFFDNNPRRNRINHVGLVTEVTEDGEIKFIHATLQLGVVVSSLKEPYYENSFIQANRVIED